MKALIFSLVLLTAGLSAQTPSEFQKLRAESEARALRLYPDADKPGTVFGAAIAAEILRLRQNGGDPLLTAPNGPEVIAATVAQRLGVKPAAVAPPAKFVPFVLPSQRIKTAAELEAEQAEIERHSERNGRRACEEGAG